MERENNAVMHNLFGKIINSKVTGGKYNDYDLNDYLYASLSQAPIKIIDKNDSNDEMDYTVECPNCGSHVIYGDGIYMISGHIYCGTKGCREKLTKKLDDEVGL